jgi:hypothetical protein
MRGRLPGEQALFLGPSGSCAATPDVRDTITRSRAVIDAPARRPNRWTKPLQDFPELNIVRHESKSPWLH